MAIGVKYYGTNKPGPGVKPLKIIDKVKHPFGMKNYPVNWASGKHLSLRGEEASSGAGSTGGGSGSSAAASAAELPTFQFHYDETTKVLTPGVCYINGIATTITSLPASISAPSVSTCYYVRITHATKTAAWTSGTTFPNQSDGYAIVPILRIVVGGGAVTDTEQRQWADIVYVVPVESGSVEGDILKWDNTGKKWAKLSPTTQTVVTDVQYDSVNHVIQKKTIACTIITKGSESGWTTITGGQAVVEG